MSHFSVYSERHVSQVSDTRGADLYHGCGRQRQSKHARTFYPSSCLFQTVECRRDGHGRTGEEGRAARPEPGRARARRAAVQTQPQAHSAGDAVMGDPAAGLSFRCGSFSSLSQTVSLPIKTGTKQGRGGVYAVSSTLRCSQWKVLHWIFLSSEEASHCGHTT